MSSNIAAGSIVRVLILAIFLTSSMRAAYSFPSCQFAAVKSSTRGGNATRRQSSKNSIHQNNGEMHMVCSGMESVSRRSALASILGAGVISNYALSASAVIAPVDSLKESDCLRDCLKECKEIAPKDPAYCTDQCASFCSSLGEGSSTK
mmetsp:Transcript_11610/g.17510  ORF Transcript_11610/g.17510 Transcript_11610/m.17510 type:complete len:149 (+) Transcript_11610:106-552(+)